MLNHNVNHHSNLVVPLPVPVLTPMPFHSPTLFRKVMGLAMTIATPSLIIKTTTIITDKILMETLMSIIIHAKIKGSVNRMIVAKNVKFVIVLITLLQIVINDIITPIH